MALFTELSDNIEKHGIIIKIESSSPTIDLLNHPRLSMPLLYYVYYKTPNLDEHVKIQKLFNFLHGYTYETPSIKFFDYKITLLATDHVLTKDNHYLHTLFKITNIADESLEPHYIEYTHDPMRILEKYVHKMLNTHNME